MTLEEAKTKCNEIISRTDLSPAQQQTQLMRLQAQLRREHPGVDLEDLGE